MTDEEQLVDIIRTSDNPTEAIMIAVRVILEFLTGQQSQEEEASALPTTRWRGCLPYLAWSHLQKQI